MLRPNVLGLLSPKGGSVGLFAEFGKLLMMFFAGYKEDPNRLPCTGIPYVIVNGTIVVKDSKVLKDVFPGQPIRYPVESKGRHEPLDVKGWVDAHAVPIMEQDEGAVADWTRDKH